MDTQATKKRFPWLKAALAVSVLLNLAALGVLGGIITRAGDQGSFLRAAISALPAEDRRVVRRETREIWREARMQRGASTSPATMIAALRAETFDPDEFAQTLQQSQDRIVKISSEMHDRIVARVSAMSLTERRAYADALQDQLDARRSRVRPRTERGQ